MCRRNFKNWTGFVLLRHQFINCWIVNGLEDLCHNYYFKNRGSIKILPSPKSTTWSISFRSSANKPTIVVDKLVNVRTFLPPPPEAFGKRIELGTFSCLKTDNALYRTGPWMFVMLMHRKNWIILRKKTPKSLLLPYKIIANSCELNGNTYEDGEYFDVDCSMRCQCLGGSVRCVPRCPVSFAVSTVNCPNPTRVQLPGECCLQWECEQPGKNYLILELEFVNFLQNILIGGGLPGKNAIGNQLKCFFCSAISFYQAILSEP